MTAMDRGLLYRGKMQRGIYDSNAVESICYDEKVFVKSLEERGGGEL